MKGSAEQRHLERSGSLRVSNQSVSDAQRNGIGRA
jgi:hypothetical protein